MRKPPKIRTVQRYKPPYPLNQFPDSFAVNLGREIVYFLATRGTDRLEGTDWEEIFACLVRAQWKPSNVGLDDIVLEQTAWGAKTVKNRNPFRATHVRLISGRCSPVFSYGDSQVADCEPCELGEKVLEIFNERVAGVRKKYKHLRTVILLKGNGLLELSVFEFDTVMYAPSMFSWHWNKRENLEGKDKKSGFHKFTWQPHGSQLTILEKVPDNRLSIRIKRPEALKKEKILSELAFDDSWVEIIQ